jgi:hypothetical protein
VSTEGSLFSSQESSDAVEPGHGGVLAMMSFRFSPRAFASPVARTSRPASSRRAVQRWRCWKPEPLEGRTLLSTFTVSDLSGDPKDPASLPHAVELANAAPGSTIVFRPGLSGVIPLADTLSVKASVTITGPGADFLAVQGGGPQSNFSVLGVLGESVTVSGLTITGGNGGSAGGGGGVSVSQGDLTLSDCVITNNSSLAGGGIFAFSSAAVTMANCTVSGNSATNGGGVSINTGATMSMTNCSISGNSIDASGFDGGGIDNRGTLTMTNCTVAGNSAGSRGGGIGNVQGTLMLINSTVAGNSGTIGGGIALLGFANVVTLRNSVVSGNSATVRGGGIDAASGGVTLRRSIVSTNFLGATPTSALNNIVGRVKPSSAFNIIGAGGSGGLINGVNNNIVLAAPKRARAVAVAARGRLVGR